MTRVNHCESQTRVAEALAFVSTEFAEMQRVLRTGGEVALEDEHETLLRAFSEPIGFPEVSDLRWDHRWLEDSFIAGQTEWIELVYAGGLQVANQYANVLSDAWSSEDRLESQPNYADHLVLQCEFLEIEAIEELCSSERDSLARDRACRDLEKIPDRDLAVIAQACEDLPYLMVCEPENPPTWFHPDADVGE
jgi:hypothetical protein